MAQSNSDAQKFAVFRNLSRFGIGISVITLAVGLGNEEFNGHGPGILVPLLLILAGMLWLLFCCMIMIGQRSFGGPRLLATLLGYVSSVTVVLVRHSEFVSS